MSIRDSYLKDYGISQEDEQKILAYCRTATGYYQCLILEAAQKTYPEIAPYLFINLTTGLGYNRMGKIPMQRKDFQGYRRKAIAILRDLIKSQQDNQQNREVSKWSVK